VGSAPFVLPAVVAGVASGILATDHGLAIVPALAAGGLAIALLGVLAGMRAPGVLALALALGFATGAWRQGEAAADPELPSVASLADGTEQALVGRVVDDPRPREDRLQLVLGDLVAVDTATRFGDWLVVWLPRGIDAGSGDLLRVDARIELAADFDGFDYRAYLARQGIGAIGRVRGADLVAPADGPAAVLTAVRGGLLGGLNDLVPEPEAALGAGILLGIRTAMDPELSDAFATAGLTHIVAVSGWNIAIVAALVTAAVRPLARRPGGRWTTAAVAAGTVAGYVVLTGASPSVVRAALMAGAMLVARLGGSRTHAGSALLLAALLMLVAAPSVLWDVGFQLSLLATAGLIWLGAPVERRLAGWPAIVREPVALTLAAQLTTLPVILVNFERLSLVAPIANVLVVPWVPIAMLFAAIASGVGVLLADMPIPLLADLLAWLAGGLAWLVLRVIVVLGSAVASVPMAAVDVTVPPALAVAWLPIVGLAAWAFGASGEREPDREGASTGPPGWLRRLAQPIPIGAAVVTLLGALALAGQPDGRLHLTALDIGQGDAILVEAPSGATMLVDGGPDPERTLRRLGASLPFFDRTIDLLVLSHPHQDHVAGLVDVHDRYRVGAMLHADIPFANPAAERLRADAVARGTEVLVARAGMRIALDATTTIEVLYPTAEDARAPLPEGDINNGSVVLVVRHGGFTALLTGDAEAPVERALVSRGILPRVDLLKVGHHGSTSSTTAELLDATRPSIAVISAGVDNEYGHPAPETLEALGAARPFIVVARTDRDGDVEVVSDGRTYRVRAAGAWSGPRATHDPATTGSIGAWPSPTATPPDACWTTPGCPMGSASTPRAWRASRWRPRDSWPRRRSRSTARSSRPPRSSTTSTRRRSAEDAGSTGSWGRDGSPTSATPSSRCRSPPTRSARCSTTTGSPSAGRR
jgi:competence protein ComEC